MSFPKEKCFKMFEIKKYIKNFFDFDNKEMVAKWVSIFDQMAIHTRKKCPSELLLKQRPNEEEHILNYRLENYRAITYGSMNRALDSVSRILNKIQFDIICDEKVKEYIEAKNFTAQATQYNFTTYFEKIILKRGIEDPNGFLVWLPEGEGLTDSSKVVDPKPHLFYCEQIHDISEDVISFLSDEKVAITRGDVTTMDGDVYYIITKEWFYKLVQTSAATVQSGTEKAKNAKFKLIPIYQHNIGEIPAIILGGDMNADGYFESFFAPYCAFGDQAISQFSDWQAIMVTSAFPYTEEFYTEELYSPEQSSNPVSSTEEKYTEEKRLVPLPRTPYGVRMRPIPKALKGQELMGENALPLDVPFKRFISPDIEIAKYSGESWEKLVEYAEDALHLNLKSNFNQTEAAKDTDKEEHYAMIDKIANNYFDHLMTNSLKYITCYILRKNIKDVEVTINKPLSNKLKTEKDLVEEISTLTTSKAPDVFISEVTNELAKRRFSGNPLSKKIFEAISIIDPLYIKSTSDKQQLFLSGTITKEANIRSVYCYSLLLQIADKVSSDAFIKMTIEQIKAKFDEAIKPYLIEETPLTNPDGTPVK